jgi:sialate O-acetylesterase
MMSLLQRSVIAVMLVAACSAWAQAEVRLPRIFGDGMVLQQGRPIVIWGWAEPGEAITVSLAEAQAQTVAKDDGRWRVELPAMRAEPDQAPLEMTVTGVNTLTLRDVLIGEVWLGSGQSNMRWSVSRSDDAQAEIAAADHPRIRLFAVQNHRTDEPSDDVRASWQVCSPTSVPDFSAVAYYFGRQLQRELDVPVGLIMSAWGGTYAEAWTPHDALAAALPQALERAAESRDRYPQQLAEHEKRLEEWHVAAAAAREAGQPEPKKPQTPRHPDEKPNMPSVLYNGMIAPLTPLSMRGVIWYQGEANAGRAEEYTGLLTALIESWRGAFEHEELAFGIVQLANYLARQTQATENSNWSHLREAQAAVARTVPRTGLAVTIDIGDADDIHPRNKQEVGRRLALWALRDVYGRQDLAASGPTLDRMTREGDQLVLHFTHVHGGLEMRGDKLTGFVIADADGPFVFADARIDGDRVIVSSPEVSQPTRVRYGWANNPDCNLYNAANLPAGPFVCDLSVP